MIAQVYDQVNGKVCTVRGTLKMPYCKFPSLIALREWWKARRDAEVTRLAELTTTFNASKGLPPFVGAVLARATRQLNIGTFARLIHVIIRIPHEILIVSSSINRDSWSAFGTMITCNNSTCDACFKGSIGAIVPGFDCAVVLLSPPVQPRGVRVCFYSCFLISVYNFHAQTTCALLLQAIPVLLPPPNLCRLWRVVAEYIRTPSASCVKATMRNFGASSRKRSHSVPC